MAEDAAVASGAAPGGADRRAALERVQAALLGAYRETLRRSERTLDSTDQALVRHVVAVSSAAAGRRLRTFEGQADDLADALGTFAEAVAADDHVGGVLAYGREKLTDIWGIAGLVIPVGLLGVCFGALDFVLGVGRAAETTGAAALQWLFRVGGVAVAVWLFRGGLALLRGYAGLPGVVATAYRGPVGVRRLLAETLDSREREFFAALDAVPPGRPVLAGIGPAAALTLTLGALLLTFLLVRAVLGALTERPTPPIIPPGLLRPPASVPAIGTCPPDSLLRLGCLPVGTPAPGGAPSPRTGTSALFATMAATRAPAALATARPGTASPAAPFPGLVAATPTPRVGLGATTLATPTTPATPATPATPRASPPASRSPGPTRP